MTRMRFDIITIFPKIFDSYFSESILGRAQERGRIEVRAWDLRSFARDKHRSVDSAPYGGGAGMVLKAEPILRAVAKVRGQSKAKVVILSAKGKPFTQKLAVAWAKRHRRIVFVTGRYEGIDERVRLALGAEEVSIGPYVLTDGDVAAMAMVSAVARLIPGVIKLKSLTEESHWQKTLQGERESSKPVLEYPHYTKPEVIEWKGRKYRVPKVLRSGNHKKIKEWRREQVGP